MIPRKQSQSRWRALRPERGRGLIAALALLLYCAAGGTADLDELACDAAQGLSPSPDIPTLVLIIDDIGHRLDTGRASTRLPGRVTLAVLPFTPHANELASAGHAAGKEIMLHAPMSSLDGGDSAESDMLSPELAEAEFRALFAKQLATVPHVSGVNNHMGSDLTRQSEQMHWLMSELHDRDLYFVDSRTTADTVAADAARAAGVPHLSRRVFLDNEPSVEAIAERFEFAVAEARRLGVAVAIGHPHPETIEFLQRALPQLEDQSIRLGWASEYADLEGAGYP